MEPGQIARVATLAAADHVIARAPKQSVTSSLPTEEAVLTGASPGASVPPDSDPPGVDGRRDLTPVATASEADDIGACAPVNGIDAASHVDAVGAGTGADEIVIATGLDHIVSVAGYDEVDCRVADEMVWPLRAHDRHGAHDRHA